MNPAGKPPARLYRADGTPRPIGVIGYPIAHSLSPVFQNVAFEQHNLPHRYQKWEVKPEDFSAFLEKARQEDFLGLNVTLPLKRAAWEQAFARSQEAEAVGAANTLLLDEANGGWLAHNTDVGGFLDALRGEDYNPLHQSTLIIGSGGASRAVVFGLAGAGASQITVVNRTVENATALVNEIASYFPQCKMQSAPLDPAAWSFNLDLYTLVVNATSQGILDPRNEFPIPGELLAGGATQPNKLFFDLTYGATPFLRAVKKYSGRATDGLSMLVYQGALAFEWWTGLVAPREKMLAATQVALQEREKSK